MKNEQGTIYKQCIILWRSWKEGRLSSADFREGIRQLKDECEPVKKKPVKSWYEPKE